MAARRKLEDGQSSEQARIGDSKATFPAGNALDLTVRLLVSQGRLHGGELLNKPMIALSACLGRLDGGERGPGGRWACGRSLGRLHGGERKYAIVRFATISLGRLDGG